MIGDIKTLIHESETVDLLNDNQDQLHTKITDALVKLEAMKTPLQALEINAGAENQKISGSLLNSNNLLDSVLQTISTMKVNDLNSSMAKIEQGLVDFNAKSDNSDNPDWSVLNELLSSLVVLSKDIESSKIKQTCLQKDLIFHSEDKNLSQISLSANERLTNWSGEIAKHKEKRLGEVEAKLRAVYFNEPNDDIANLAAFPANELDKLQRNLKQLEPTSEQTLTCLDKVMGEFFTQIQAKAQQYNVEFTQHQKNLSNLPSDEAEITLELTTNALNGAKLAFQNLPVQHLETIGNSLNLLKEHPKSEAASDNLMSLNLMLAQLNRQVKEKEKASLRLDKRIQDRKESVADFKTKFEQYIANRSTRYRIKDFFNSQDWKDRSTFINGENELKGLTQKLEEYAKSGDSQPLLDHLNEKSYPGYNLQPIINRLKLAIKKIATKGDEEVDKHAYNRSYNLALTVLPQQFRQHIYELINAINKLKQDEIQDEISNQDDKEVARTLANDLTQKVKDFVIDNQEELDQNKLGQNNSSQRLKDLLDLFKSDFDCLLHSQDDVLSKYESTKTIFKNIGLALLTVVTLSGYLWYSLYKNDSFFYKPDAIETADGVNELAKKLEYPAV